MARLTSLDILHKPLPYAHRLQARPAARIDLLVVHCTELPDLAAAREFGERIVYPDSATGNCGHFYIERSGRIEQWVPLERVAHHVRGYNERSIGVELDNLGRYPDWFGSGHQEMTQPYAREQLESLVRLARLLRRRLPSLRWIAGHESLDGSCVPATDDPAKTVQRKRDPGPLFPWPPVLERTQLEAFSGAPGPRGATEL